MSNSRQRFVETCLVTAGEFKKQNLNESVLSKTIESTDGKAYKAKAVYTFPISRPDKENLNGRVYTSKLWEKVIKEKQAEGCFGLMDHPEDDGSTKNAWCVWRDLRFSEDKKLVIADAYLFGFWGQQVLEALEAGGSVGLSTSGFGEFKDDDKTLNEDTYQLERVADFVLNPSYEVFGHQEDLKTESLNASFSRTDESWIPVDHSSEIAYNFNKYQKANNKYTTYVAKAKSDLKLYGKNTDRVWGEWDQPVFKYFDRARSEKFNLDKDFKFVLVDKPSKDGAYISWYADDWWYVNGIDYDELMDNVIMIKEENKTLESSPNADKEIVMENIKSTVSPSIEEKSLLLNIRSMFKEAKQITNIFEQQDNYNSLLSYFDEKLNVSGADLKKEIEAASKENDALIHAYVEEHDDLDKKAADLEKKNADLEKELADTKDKLEKAEADLKESADKLTVITNENADLEKKFNESCNMLDNFKIYATKQKEIVRTLEAEKNGMVSPKEFKEAIIYSQSLEEKINELKNELYEAKKAKKKEDDDELPDEDGDEVEEPETPEEPEDDADDLEKVDDKKKKESFANDNIRDYYRDLECRNPKVTLIKADIMRCRTLLEAQMTYLRLKSLVEESSVGYSDRAVKAQTRMATEEEKQVKHTALREGWL